MFYMRFYYDKSTGEILTSRWASGEIVVPTVAQECTMLPELEGRTDEDTGVIEFTDEETAPVDKFGVMKPAVDLTQDPPSLTWEEWPEPAEPSDDDPVSGDELLTMFEEVL